jgi:hypothetical protein
VIASPELASSSSSPCSVELHYEDNERIKFYKKDTLEKDGAHFTLGPWKDEYFVRLSCSGFEPAQLVKVHVAETHELDLGKLKLKPIRSVP